MIEVFMKLVLIACIVAFVVAFIVAKPIISWLLSIKAKQTILEYVELHKDKQGTPTMGGLIILFGLIAGSVLCFNGEMYLATMTLIVTLGFGLIGFLDDFLKIKYKHNLGLQPYQKIIGQVGISVLIGLFCYFSPLIDNALILPFSFESVEIGFWIVPVVVFVFLSLVNAVNLIDGLDGLAGSVSITYTIGFMAVLFIYIDFVYSAGAGALTVNELTNLGVVGSALIGSILAFLIFNSNRASVFMGDVGSLAIGGCLTCLAVFSGLILYIPLLGIAFVLTALSVVIQVLHYKRTKKRVFLMAPLHHHFEKKGVNETKIVSIYIILTIIVSVITIMLTIF